MAAAPRPRHRALVLVHDPSEGILVYKVNLKHLFHEPEPSFPPVLSFPDPAARFNHLQGWEDMRAAVSGSVIAVATSMSRTLLCDTRSSAGVSSGPDVPYAKSGLMLLPVGADRFFVMPLLARFDRHSLRYFQLLLRPTAAARRWAWRAMPNPPLAHTGPGRATQDWQVASYFVQGARIWISFYGEGTFSLDTATRRWRQEGTWMLPLVGRAHSVPNFLGDGRQLLFGFRARDYHLSVCDMAAAGRPPAIIRSWEEACPTSEAWRAGYRTLPETNHLAYLGGHKFCISTEIFTVCSGILDGGRPSPKVLSLMAVKVTPELLLIKRGFNCYTMPTCSLGAHLL